MLLLYAVVLCIFFVGIMVIFSLGQELCDVVAYDVVFFIFFVGIVVLFSSSWEHCSVVALHCYVVYLLHQDRDYFFV